MKVSTGQLRKFATIVIIVVAVAASLASSPDDSTIRLDPVSGTAELSYQNPQVHIPFTVSTSSHIGEGARVGVHIETEWTDTDEATVQRGADISVETRSGIQSSAGGDIYCHWDCIGSNRLVLRWPLEDRNGSVRIQWTIDVAAEFNYPDPPDGAEITLDVGEPE